MNKKKKKNPIRDVNTKCSTLTHVLLKTLFSGLIIQKKKPQQFVINTVDICESSAASLALQKNKRKFHP